jgi:inner membrane protein
VIAGARLGRPHVALAGLIWGAAYLSLGAVQKERVRNVQGELISSRGHTATRKDVYLTFMNQVTWRSLYESNGEIYIDQIRVPYWGTICTKSGTKVPPLPPPSPQLGPRALRGHQLLRWFSSGWVSASPEDPTLLGDTRYSFRAYGAHPFWGIRIDKKNDRVEWVQTRRERKMGPGAVLDMIFTNPSGSVCR